MFYEIEEDEGEQEQKILKKLITLFPKIAYMCPNVRTLSSNTTPSMYPNTTPSMYNEQPFPETPFSNSIFSISKDVSVSPNFQLPTIFNPKLKPSSISVNRVNPLHMTIFPGGGSDARPR